MNAAIAARTIRSRSRRVSASTVTARQANCGTIEVVADDQTGDGGGGDGEPAPGDGGGGLSTLALVVLLALLGGGAIFLL